MGENIYCRKRIASTTLSWHVSLLLLLPAGIAIYDAQQRGFPSVAHWLQAQLLKDKNPTAGPAAAAAAAPAATKPMSSSGSNVSSEGEAEVATACTAAAAAEAGKPVAGKKGAAAAGRKKGAAAASAAAEYGPLSSQESCHDDAAVAVAATAVAPGTPQKAFEAPTPGPAVAEEGAAVRRSTRAAAAAAAGVGGKLAAAAKAAAAAVMVAAVPASKRACVGESVGTRKSLRFKH